MMDTSLVTVAPQLHPTPTKHAPIACGSPSPESGGIEIAEDGFDYRLKRSGLTRVVLHDLLSVFCSRYGRERSMILRQIIMWHFKLPIRHSDEINLVSDCILAVSEEGTDLPFPNLMASCLLAESCIHSLRRTVGFDWHKSLDLPTVFGMLGKFCTRAASEISAVCSEMVDRYAFHMKAVQRRGDQKEVALQRRLRERVRTVEEYFEERKLELYREYLAAPDPTVDPVRKLHPPYHGTCQRRQLDTYEEQREYPNRKHELLQGFVAVSQSTDGEQRDHPNRKRELLHGFVDVSQSTYEERRDHPNRKPELLHDFVDVSQSTNVPVRKLLENRKQELLREGFALSQSIDDPVRKLLENRKQELVREVFALSQSIDDPVRKTHPSNHGTSSRRPCSNAYDDGYYQHMVHFDTNTLMQMRCQQNDVSRPSHDPRVPPESPIASAHEHFARHP